MESNLTILGWVFILALMGAQYLYNRRVFTEKEDEIKELNKEVESLKEEVDDLKNPIEAKIKSSFRKSMDAAFLSGESPEEDPHHTFPASVDFPGQFYFDEVAYKEKDSSYDIDSLHDMMLKDSDALCELINTSNSFRLFRLRKEFERGFDGTLMKLKIRLCPTSDISYLSLKEQNLITLAKEKVSDTASSYIAYSFLYRMLSQANDLDEDLNEDFEEKEGLLFSDLEDNSSKVVSAKEWSRIIKMVGFDKLDKELKEREEMDKYVTHLRDSLPDSFYKSLREKLDGPDPQESVVDDVASIQDSWDSELLEFCNDTLSKFEERLDRAIQEQDVTELRTTHNLLCMHLMNKIDQVTSRNHKRKKVN
jgi:hypothetical protein